MVLMRCVRVAKHYYAIFIVVLFVLPEFTLGLVVSRRLVSKSIKFLM